MDCNLILIILQNQRIADVQSLRVSVFLKTQTSLGIVLLCFTQSRIPPILVSFSRYITVLRRRFSLTLHKLLCVSSGVQSVQITIFSEKKNREAERSEPSSRSILIGEQPNPWELLHPRDMLSRHRGAELRRRYGRLGGTSLLSPE